MDDSPMQIIWQFEGVEELANRLFKLDNEVRRNIAAKAVDAAASVLLSPMRAAAPVGKTGNLRAAIGKATRRYNTTTFGIVGPQYPRGSHGHLVEHGTKQRKTKGAGPVQFKAASRGRMPKNPFIANTYRSHGATATSTLISVLTSELEAAGA